MARDGIEGLYSVAIARHMLGERVMLPIEAPAAHQIAGRWGEQAKSAALTLNQRSMAVAKAHLADPGSDTCAAMADILALHGNELWGREMASPTYGKFHLLFFLVARQTGFYDRADRLLRQLAALWSLTSDPTGHIVTTAGRAHQSEDAVLDACYRHMAALRQDGNVKTWTLGDRPDSAVLAVLQRLTKRGEYPGLRGDLPRIHNETTIRRYQRGHVAVSPVIGAPDAPQWAAAAIYRPKGEAECRYVRLAARTYRGDTPAPEPEMATFLASLPDMGPLVETWSLGPHAPRVVRAVV